MNRKISLLLLVSIILSFCISIPVSKSIFICKLGMYKQHDRNVWADMVCSQEIALCRTSSIKVSVYPQMEADVDPSIGFKVRVLSEHIDFEQFFQLSELKNDEWNDVNIYNGEMRKLDEHATVYIESVNMTEQNYIRINLGEDLNTVHYETYIMEDEQGTDNITLSYDRFSYVSFGGMVILLGVIIFGALYKVNKRLEVRE